MQAFKDPTPIAYAPADILCLLFMVATMSLITVGLL